MSSLDYFDICSPLVVEHYGASARVRGPSAASTLQQAGVALDSARHNRNRGEAERIERRVKDAQLWRAAGREVFHALLARGLRCTHRRSFYFWFNTLDEGWIALNEARMQKLVATMIAGAGAPTLDWYPEGPDDSATRVRSLVNLLAVERLTPQAPGGVRRSLCAIAQRHRDLANMREKTPDCNRGLNTLLPKANIWETNPKANRPAKSRARRKYLWRALRRRTPSSPPHLSRRAALRPI